MDQSELVELATDKGYKGLNNLWFDKNNLSEPHWYVELCLMRKWLWEEHDRHIMVEPVLDEDTGDTEFIGWVIVDESASEEEEYHKSPIIAMEHALKEAFEMLKDLTESL